MIPCAQPCFVVLNDGLRGFVVAAWDADGHPMIAVAGNGLERAESALGDRFEVLSAADHDPQGIVQLIPCTDDVSQIAWALCNDGKVRAVFFDEDEGYASAANWRSR